jgi:hypothetical protein
LAIQRAVRALVIAVVLPFAQLFVKQLHVVTDPVPVEERVELLVVDAV